MTLHSGLGLGCAAIQLVERRVSDPALLHSGSSWLTRTVVPVAGLSEPTADSSLHLQLVGKERY